MFSQACVKNSVGGGGVHGEGGICGKGVGECVTKGGHAWQRGCGWRKRGMCCGGMHGVGGAEGEGERAWQQRQPLHPTVMHSC